MKMSIFFHPFSISTLSWKFVFKKKMEFLIDVYLFAGTNLGILIGESILYKGKSCKIDVPFHVGCALSRKNISLS